MVYKFSWRHSKIIALIATSDCRVVQATPNMQWAIGKDIESVSVWCAERGIKRKYLNEKVRF